MLAEAITQNLKDTLSLSKVNNFPVFQHWADEVIGALP